MSRLHGAKNRSIVRAPQYGLFSYEKQPMLDVLEGNLPIIED
ncbi:hypothetical protein [Vibrio sp. SG41-7]|nr:hypothetical protein [Vibrio sp. SG41-7]